MTAFFDYLAQYDKQYSDLKETARRYTYFKRHFDNVRRNKALEQATEIDLRINKYADLSEEEFLNQIIGELVIPKQVKQQAKIIQQTSETALNPSYANYQGPQEFNWFDKGLKLSKQDYHKCQASWAQATAQSIEALAYIKGQKKSLSSQQIIDCDLSNSQCSSGWTGNSLHYSQEYGVMAEDTYDFIKNQTSDSSQCHFYPSNSLIKTKDYEIESGLSNMRLKLLLQTQPVIVHIQATSQLMLYHDGYLTSDFLKCNSNQEPNLAVLLVGYGQTDLPYINQCQEYWILKANFDPEWGQEGVFKLCMDYSEGQKYGTCSLNKYVMYPTDLENLFP